MRISVLPGAAIIAFALAACGNDTPAENGADALDEAAEYSTPEAANVLENEADRLREANDADPAAVQNALQEAGNAQVSPPPPTGGP